MHTQKGTIALTGSKPQRFTLVLMMLHISDVGGRIVSGASQSVSRLCHVYGGGVESNGPFSYRNVVNLKCRCSVIPQPIEKALCHHRNDMESLWLLSGV